VQNPPPSLLEAEVAKNTAFSLALLGSLPSVAATLSAEPLGGGAGAVRVRLRLQNSGFLPTQGAQKAVSTKAVRAHGLATLALPAGATLLHGPRTVEVPHLSGRVAMHDPESAVASAYGSSAANPHEATVATPPPAPPG
jgi:hypothetical protein